MEVVLLFLMLLVHCLRPRGLSAVSAVSRAQEVASCLSRWVGSATLPVRSEVRTDGSAGSNSLLFVGKVYQAEMKDMNMRSGKHGARRAKRRLLEEPDKLQEAVEELIASLETIMVTLQTDSEPQEMRQGLEWDESSEVLQRQSMRSFWRDALVLESSRLPNQHDFVSKYT